MLCVVPLALHYWMCRLLGDWYVLPLQAGAIRTRMLLLATFL